MYKKNKRTLGRDKKQKMQHVKRKLYDAKVVTGVAKGTVYDDLN